MLQIVHMVSHSMCKTMHTTWESGGDWNSRVCFLKKIKILCSPGALILSDCIVAALRSDLSWIEREGQSGDGCKNRSSKPQTQQLFNNSAHVGKRRFSLWKQLFVSMWMMMIHTAVMTHAHTHTHTHRVEAFVTHLLHFRLSVWCLLGVHKRAENPLWRDRRGEKEQRQSG